MAPRLAWRPLIVTILVAVGLAVGGPSSAAPGWQHVWSAPAAQGATLAQHVRSDPLRATVLHVAPDAPARFGVVVSGDRVDGHRETVSSMCRRAGAVACVNAHFAVCGSCGQPHGSVVRDGLLLRTPTDDHHDDVSIIGGRFTSDPWEWAARLEVPAATPLEQSHQLGLQGVNVDPVHDGIVLYTGDFGPRTPAPGGSYEVVAGAPEPIRTGPAVRQRLELRAAHLDGGAAIPPDGIVLSGVGAGAERLRRFVEQGPGAVDLVVDTPAGLEQTVSGHPVLLRDGQRAPLHTAGGRHLVRHPRTVVGWDDGGSVWLVVVDGRQAASRGIGLADVADYLLLLGATDAVNLDGGGSSTLVARCPHSTDLCVRNQPSDGAEREVPTALALFGTPVAPPAPPPPPPPPTTAVPVTVPATTIPTVGAATAGVRAAATSDPVEVALVPGAVAAPAERERASVGSARVANAAAAPPAATSVAGPRHELAVAAGPAGSGRAEPARWPSTAFAVALVAGGIALRRARA